LRAIALASYRHAQNNPRALMYGKPLDEARYDASRWIVEPFHLFDCCMENDGAAAVVLVDAGRARDFPNEPVYLLGAASGASERFGAQAHNSPDYASANFTTVAPELYRMAGLTPADVGVVQCYENFTGGVVMALAEHGFFAPGEANDFLTLENLLAPTGRLPLNTSGGNLAECYMHGFELVLEAVRQVRGTSCNPVARNDVALVVGGPMVAPASDLLLGSQDALERRVVQ
jgi:acetyl-CoA acetyltransferase